MVNLDFINEEDRKKKNILKFLKKGQSGGEKAAYLTEDITKVKKGVSSMDIELPKNKKLTNFSIASTQSAYHSNGLFKPAEILKVVKEFYETTKKEKKTVVRSTVDMPWVLKGILISDKLMESKSKLNVLLEIYITKIVYLYNPNKFDGACILECLKVYPYIIVREQIAQNPYCLSPETYLN